MVNMEMYVSAMEAFGQILHNCSEKEFDEFYPLVSDFQMKWMKKFVEEMSTETKALRVMKECFWYAVTESSNGSSILYNRSLDNRSLDTKDELEELCAKYADYADFQIEEEDDGTFTLDAVFYGAYVPYWDGWREE